MTITTFTWVFSATVVHILCVSFVTYHCLIRRREANSALLWIFLTWSFPVIGFLLFGFFGHYRLSGKGWEKHCSDQQLLSELRTREASPQAIPNWKKVHAAASRATRQINNPISIRLDNAIAALGDQCPLLGDNQIELLVDGDQAYPRMLQAIAEAKSHIHLQSFIIANDQVGKQFMESLAAKARLGIQVKVLYDNLGCAKARWSLFFTKYRNIPNLRLTPWTQVNLFKREFQVNLRNHRKLLVIDGRHAFTGGINIARQNLTSPGRPAIRDYHFHLRGPVVQELQYSFLRDWHFMTEDGPENLLTNRHFPSIGKSGNAAIRVINSGPTTFEMEKIADVFFSAISAAQEQILIVTPYFIPFREIIQGLRIAARRGVRVQLVVPRKNNHFYAGWASRSVYEELLLAGVEIYERHSPFIHAKAMLVDRAVALVGTANFDACSLRLDYETNIAVFDQSLIDKLYEICHQEIEASRQIDLEAWLSRPTYQILMENFCGLLSPVL